FYYLALVLTQKELIPIMLNNGKSLETQYLAHYQKIAKAQDNPDLVLKDTLLYNAFWKPIAEKLGNAKTIYLSPDGVYHQINLNTLLNPQTKQYVIEEGYDIQLLTNLKDLLTTQKNNTNKTALFFGRPQYNMSQENYQALPAEVRGIESENSQNQAITEINWSDLKETETEVKAINELLQDKKWTTAVFLGKEALEGRLKKVKNPTILHIATHGYFRSKGVGNAMLNSGIVLAGVNTTKEAGSEDGILTALEASNLYLDETDLVVLSACETGLGEVSNGEGVYGLQRGFQVAGTKSLIMSLWKVDDKVTQRFMQLFYKAWLSEGKTKRVAFKEAQAQIKKDNQYPYFWGAFVMIGE
ncbi:MAG: CHAT domain-containing protein, partial [Thermoflexibacter sp.]|nr:CHAT domain-containing protein [Thermoflexibacter sp.]